ncbi:MAG: hypothetical protein JNK78_11415 [Planctomycetes bacterium]|nr:hypothetical protein [Planctomycetota bacterium]
MNIPPRRSNGVSFRRVLIFVAALAAVKLAAAACGGGSPARYGGHGLGSQGQPAGNGAWSHRSSQGGGDVSVGGDGSGFHYYIDSSGSSWTGG